MCHRGGRRYRSYCPATPQFLLGVWMQHDFQDIYEGQKSSSESVKLTQNTGGQLLCLPKAVEVASVIAAETLPPTFHAADLNSF